MVDETLIDQAVAVIAVLADRTRLGILAQLRGGELAAGELQRRLGITQPLTSYHLRVLSEAGLVHARRAGTFIYYSADEDGWNAAITTVNAVFAESA